MVMADGGEVIDRMFEALARGDCAAALACFKPDGQLWHGFDGIAHDRPAILEQWQALVDNSVARVVADVRRQATAGGFVQQHVMAVTGASGATKAWPICIVVRIEQGLIARLDEYIDRAGFFVPAPGAPLVSPDLQGVTSTLTA